MFKKLILFICLLSAQQAFAQKNYTYFPAEVLITPFQANFLEPKVGVMFHTGQNDLRLDIGATRDLLWIQQGEHTMNVGADFFTYTKLRGEKDFHFPVDAVDYLFGINTGLLVKKTGHEYGFRLRLSHISAHLVDGHYDGTTNRWRNGQVPRVYSREFIEFTPYLQNECSRVYLSYTYLFHVNPDFLGRNILQVGGEHYFTGLLPKKVTPFVAADLKLRKIYSYRVNQNIMAGFKFSAKNYGPGASLYFCYYNGTNNHGEYFDFTEDFTGIGFNLDF